MKKDAGSFTLSAIALVIVALLLRLAISLKLVLPDSLIDWISASQNPRLALWLVGGLGAAGLAFLLKIGVKIPWFKDWLDTPAAFLKPALAFPTLLYGSILVVLGISLYFLGPICESPAVNISVTSADETMKYDGRSVTAKPGSILTLEATTKDTSVIFCKWSTTGNAVEAINPQFLCATQISLVNKPGRGIVTLTVSKTSCSITSTYPLEINIMP